MSQFPAFNVGTRSAFVGLREPARSANRGRVAAQPSSHKRKAAPSPISTSWTAASGLDKRPRLALVRSEDTPPGSPSTPHLPSPADFGVVHPDMPTTPPLRGMPPPESDFETFDLSALSRLDLGSEPSGA